MLHHNKHINIYKMFVMTACMLMHSDIGLQVMYYDVSQADNASISTQFLHSAI